MYLSSCKFFLLLGLVSSYRGFRVNAIVRQTEDQQLPNGPPLASATPMAQDSSASSESLSESSQQVINTPMSAPSETQVEISNNPIASTIDRISPAPYQNFMTVPPPHYGPEVVLDDFPKEVETEVPASPPKPLQEQATIRPAPQPTTNPNPRGARRRLDFSDPVPPPDPIPRDENGAFSSSHEIDDEDERNGARMVPRSMDATSLVENDPLVKLTAGESPHPARDGNEQIMLVPRNDSPIFTRPIAADEGPSKGSLAPKKRSGEGQDSLRPGDFNREGSPIKGSPSPQGSPRIPGKQLDVPNENSPIEGHSKKSDPFPRECSTSPTKRKRSISPNGGLVSQKTPEPEEKRTSPRKTARSRAVSPTSGRPIRSAQEASDTRDKDMENLVEQQSSNFDVLGKRRYKHENHRSRLNAQVDETDEKPKRRRIFKRLRPDTDDNSNIILWTIGATVVMFTLSALAFMLLRKAAPPKTGPNGVRRPSVIPIDL